MYILFLFLFFISNIYLLIIKVFVLKNTFSKLILWIYINCSIGLIIKALIYFLS